MMKRVCEFYAERPERDGNIKINLLVNGKITGCLIGSRGAIKNQMQDEFDCKMFVDKEEKEGSSEKLVKLNGEVITFLKLFAVSATN